jgi:cellulose synthase/poly-beta-1,6-N-acetylglucosamine synthase-like glycosyltransferase
MTLLNSSLSLVTLVLYYASLATLALLGLHRLWLVILFATTRRSDPDPPAPAEWPVVTVQLPIFNELYVAKRLIDAVCRLDYPLDRLEIQVLDDSDDDTRQVIAESVADQRLRGLDIHHLHRTQRQGYKAGALAAGLQVARGQLVAIFDADFVPAADFLRRTVPQFTRPEIGMVQARWDHLNRFYSLLTRIQAIFLDGHFVLEHAARATSGRFFNFNGTAGIWRRQAIEQSGGWTQDTLTEDLDLSYRAQLAGWEFVFLPQVTVNAELPVDVRGFKRQQFRWAKGSIQTARKLLPTILSAPIDLKKKVEAFIHLTNNGAYLLMILLSILAFPAMIVRHNQDLHWMSWLDLALFATATLPILIFYVVSQVAVSPRRPQQALHLLALMALGIGLSVNNARAVLMGLIQDGGVFERTPKYRIEGRNGAWMRKRYQAPRDSSFVFEGLLALFQAIGIYFSIRLDLWASLPFLALFFAGYSWIFLLSLAPTSRPRRVSGEPSGDVDAAPRRLYAGVPGSTDSA